jgi:hypothetical protein
LRILTLDLVADPGGAVDVADLLVGLIQVDPGRLLTHQSACFGAVAFGAGHEAVLLRVVVESDDLELLVFLIGTWSGPRQRHGFLAAATTLMLDCLTTLLLLLVGHQRHHYPVGAKVNPCRSGCPNGCRNGCRNERVVGLDLAIGG